MHLPACIGQEDVSNPLSEAFSGIGKLGFGTDSRWFWRCASLVPLHRAVGARGSVPRPASSRRRAMRTCSSGCSRSCSSRSVRDGRIDQATAALRQAQGEPADGLKVGEFSPGTVKTAGSLQLLAVLGLILPVATGVAAWLIPTAGTGVVRGLLHGAVCAGCGGDRRTAQRSS